MLDIPYGAWYNLRTEHLFLRSDLILNFGMSGNRDTYQIRKKFERNILMKKFIIDITNKLNIYFKSKISVKGGVCV